MESLVLFHDQKSGAEIIPSRLLIPSGLKKSTKGGTKILPSRFLSHF